MAVEKQDGEMFQPITELPPLDTVPKLAYTIAELCQASGISRAKVYEEIKAKRLRIKKVGARTVVPVDEARAWLKIGP